MPVTELERLIYEQATRNYAQYLLRCKRRAEQAQTELLHAAEELERMQARLIRSHA